MEESPRDVHSAEKWREALAQTIDKQRRRAGERIAGQRDRLRDLETRITAQVESALQELKAKEQSLGERGEQSHKLAELRTQLDARQVEVQQRQAALEQAQRKLSELENERGRLHYELERNKNELERQKDEAQQVQGLRDELERQKDEARKVTGLRVELERVRHDSQVQIEQLQADQGKSHDAQVKSLHQQLDELRKKLAAEEKKLTDEEAHSEKTRKDLEKQLADAKQAGGKANAIELKKLQDDNKKLEKRLEEAEEKAKQGGGGGGQDMEDLRRRFEMAVQDVRELKTKNTELTEQLNKAKQSGGAAAPAAGGGGGDWESLKQKLLADLESDFDENDEAKKADKLTVQGAIKITDQVVAEKDREIQELRRVLDSQSQQVGDVAVGAAAFTQLLDTDELIRQERESLKRLQDGLREQLRQAEVDISVERAKLARERTELDEKIRGLEAEKANMGPGGGDGHEKGKKPAGRKWLARLGLGESKE
jgi:chromosome segregation ATPase